MKRNTQQQGQKQDQRAREDHSEQSTEDGGGTESNGRATTTTEDGISSKAAEDAERDEELENELILLAGEEAYKQIVDPNANWHEKIAALNGGKPYPSDLPDRTASRSPTRSLSPATSLSPPHHSLSAPPPRPKWYYDREGALFSLPATAPYGAPHLISIAPALSAPSFPSALTLPDGICTVLATKSRRDITHFLDLACISSFKLVRKYVGPSRPVDAASRAPVPNVAIARDRRTVVAGTFFYEPAGFRWAQRWIWDLGYASTGHWALRAYDEDLLATGASFVPKVVRKEWKSRFDADAIRRRENGIVEEWLRDQIWRPRGFWVLEIEGEE